MNAWKILGIEKTTDLNEVRKAYAEKSKLYHPETYPEEFKLLHEAYKMISAEIKRGTISQQQPIKVQEAEKQLTQTMQKGIFAKLAGLTLQKKPKKQTRDIKQDEDFLKLVEREAQNSELRHTDKRDMQQVLKVENIVQQDKNTKQLEWFRSLLRNEFFYEGWRKFFVSREFLERQYEQDFINALAEIVEERLLEIINAKKGTYPSGPLVYFIIVYGCIFDQIGHLRFEEHIYRKELFTKMLETFRLDADKLFSYVQLERNEELLGERYAFYLYRNILEHLDEKKPNKEKMKAWIMEGFYKENTSRLLEFLHYTPKEGGFQVQPSVYRMQDKIVCSSVFFDLMAYLVTEKRENIHIFKEVLLEVCEMKWGSDVEEEKEILMLLLMDS